MKLMWPLLLVYTASASVMEVSSRCDYVEGYYWRDFTGDIPSDAVQGGSDRERQTTYIGQGIHRSSGTTVPGKISQIDRKLHFEYDFKEFAEVEDVKILCSQHPDRFQWIPTGSDTLISHVVKDKQLVIGGNYRKPNAVAIGRTVSSGLVEVGKVSIQDNKFMTFHFATEGRGSNMLRYEVLVYDTDMHTSYVNTDGGGCQKNIHIHVH